MDGAVIRVAGGTARARIAAGWVAPDTPITLGGVTLRPHQREAVLRARVSLETHGGVLVADEVGLGKTFIALALAAGARRPLVAGPAALRTMWAQACAQTEVRAAYRSYESLSRSPMSPQGCDLVILDEAHHVRTPRTVRYRHLAQGVVGARVVLLTATPIHNSDRDLRALLALFLGATAWTLDDAALSAHIIRREPDDVALDAPLPTLAPPRILTMSDDEDLLDALISLPAPVPPRDGGDGGALLSFTLTRLWASSHFALRMALRRRLQLALALEDALVSGRHPTRGELRAWTVGEDATQLAFPELVSSGGDGEVSDLLRAVRVHAEALERLIRRMPIDSPRDGERAERVRDIVARHRGEKIVAFTQFADTAAALFRLLRDSARCCRLDGRGAQVAGGRLTRQEALSRFAPRASGTAEPAPAERIDLLITTDLLSEGVNLQDASVVVHLDFPWTSARIAQRVGRSRRLGAVHSSTVVYAIGPPAGSEALLRQEQRLRDKLNAAARFTGACGAILPVRFSLSSPAEADHPSVPARDVQLLRALVARWRSHQIVPVSRDELPVAHVRAPTSGALALVTQASEPVLVAFVGGRFSERPADVLSAARLAEGDDHIEGNLDRVAELLAKLEVSLAARAGAAAAGVGHSIAGAARRVAMQRIAHIAARTPHHHRAQVAPLAADARRIVTAPYGVGAERILAELAGAPLPDEAWLRAVRAFGEANCGGAGGAKGAGGAAGAETPWVVEALIVFEP